MAADETLEKIVTYLSEHDEGTDSSFIGEKFLALKGGNPAVTKMMVAAVMKKSPLAWCDEKGLWFAKSVSSPLIMNEPFLICTPLLSNDRRSIIQLSLIKVEGDDQELLCSYRLRESDELLIERGEKVVDTLEEAFATFLPQLRKGRVLFASQYEQRLLLKYLLDAGFSLPENLLLLSHIFRMSDTPMTGRGEGLVGLAQSLIPVEKEPVTAVDQGRLCAELVIALFQKMQESGVATLDQFAQKETEETLHAVWQKAQFSLDDFRALNEQPGVYGYQDGHGNYIYVGKGTNVRNRLISYFRYSDESPAKLLKLREEAVTFACHYCGNELEAIILESRLIKKYNPPYNTQVDIHPPKEGFSAIPAGIYMLPAQSDEQCYTLWYNGKGKVVTKTVNRMEPGFSPEELESFFYRGGQEEPTQEIYLIERWLRPRLGTIDRVDAESCENGEQLTQIGTEALLVYSGEVSIYR